MVSLFIRLGIILSALTGLFILLPESTGLPTEVATSIATMLSYVRALDYVLPVNTLLSVLGLSLAFHAGVFLFKGLAWLMKHLTTGSAGS